MKRELREKSYRGHHTGEFQHRGSSASDSQANCTRCRIGDHRTRPHRLHDYHEHKLTHMRVTRCNPNRQDFLPRRRHLFLGRFERVWHRTKHR